MLSDSAQLVIESYLDSITLDIKATTTELHDLASKEVELQNRLETLLETKKALEILLPSRGFNIFD